MTVLLSLLFVLSCKKFEYPLQVSTLITIKTVSDAPQYVAVGRFGTDVYKITLNFYSEDSLVVDELKFAFKGDYAWSVKVGTAYSRVVRGIAELKGLKIVVPKGGAGVNQDVYVSFPTVGSIGIKSGSIETLGLYYVGYKKGSVRGSQTPFTEGANIMLVGSKPIVAITAPMGIPKLVSGQYVEAITVSVSADTTGDIRLNTISFNSSLVNATVKTTGANNFIVKDATLAPICNLGYFSSPNGGDAGVNFSSCSGAGYLIPKGTTKVFRIFIPIDVVGSGQAYLNTKLRSSVGFNWTDVYGNNKIFSSDNFVYLTNYPDTTIRQITN